MFGKSVCIGDQILAIEMLMIRFIRN